MSSSRQQAFIAAPLEGIWSLVGDVDRHTEWWPRVVEVRCEGLEEGCTYRQVFKSPTGTVETDMHVERLDECRELKIRCLETGTFTRWLMTEARDGTFVDVEFGLDPQSTGARVFDVVAGKRWFRRWLQQSIEALREAAGEKAAA